MLASQHGAPSRNPFTRGHRGPQFRLNAADRCHPVASCTGGDVPSSACTSAVARTAAVDLDGTQRTRTNPVKASIECLRAAVNPEREESWMIHEVTSLRVAPSKCLSWRMASTLGLQWTSAQTLSRFNGGCAVKPVRTHRCGLKLAARRSARHRQRDQVTARHGELRARRVRAVRHHFASGISCHYRSLTRKHFGRSEFPQSVSGCSRRQWKKSDRWFRPP